MNRNLLLLAGVGGALTLLLMVVVVVLVAAPGEVAIGPAVRGLITLVLTLGSAGAVGWYVTQKNLEASDKEGVGEVTACRDAGYVKHRQRYFTHDVMVTLKDGTRHRRQGDFPRTTVVGATFPVRMNLEAPKRLVVDFDKRLNARPAAPAADDVAGRLAQLDQLRALGTITDEEHAAQRSRILATL